jgi:hypothetical protein
MHMDRLIDVPVHRDKRSSTHPYFTFQQWLRLRLCIVTTDNVLLFMRDRSSLDKSTYQSFLFEKIRREERQARSSLCLVPILQFLLDRLHCMVHSNVLWRLMNKVVCSDCHCLLTSHVVVSRFSGATLRPCRIPGDFCQPEASLKNTTGDTAPKSMRSLPLV